MRVLLDECVPCPLRKLLPDHQVQTVQDAGWEGKHNGELLLLAQTRLDAFVTADKNLRYQQKLNSERSGLWSFQRTTGAF
jgi:hypothetical protein